ncbi:MAG: multicopper oxidase domain-containing protein [Gracilimonas sp.]|nr:multicopper oxidase domain-containing protein [Gracilimonas sp.]
MREILKFGNLSITSNVPHPMHVHAVHFKVLERSGNRGLLPTETGWKDTVLVMPGERVKVIMKFDAPKGLYIFHCHNLEHEDAGMMANFQIIN